MRVNHLLSAILRGPFALQHETALGYLPRVAQLLNGEGLAEGKLPTQAPAEASVVFAAAGPVAVRSRRKSYDDAAPGSVAVITIKGVMMKEDEFGLCEDVPGTASLGRAIQEADQHDNIAAILLSIDSGGGAVDGMIEFNAIIANTKKKVVAYTDGIIGSAAYTAASGTDLIVLNNVSCSVGSIGVMASMADYQPMLEKMGVKFHNLRAEGSERKNEDFYQLLKGNYKPYTANVLTPLKEMMHAAVRQGRGKKLKDTALQGDMFFANDAIKQGLADEIGDFAYAVNRALELANAAGSGEVVEDDVDTNPGNPPATDPLHEDEEDDSDADPNATQLPQPTMFGKNKFPAVAALAGLSGAALTAELVTAANDELEAAGITGAALITQASHEVLTSASATLGTMTAALTAAGAADVTALATDRDSWKQQAEAFGSQPGALGSAPEKTGNDVTEEGGNDAQKTVDALHEKMLSGN